MKRVKSGPLCTEINTPAVERRILRAARAILGLPRAAFDLETVFEHGHWWVTVRSSGAQYSVVDSTGGVDGFELEQVTRGEMD